MFVPEKIKFLGREVTIKKQEVLLDKPTVLGLSDTINDCIILKESLKEDQVGAVLMHELLEHIVNDNELKVKHEHLSVIANMLYSILRENKIKFYD